MKINETQGPRAVDVANPQAPKAAESAGPQAPHDTVSVAGSDEVRAAVESAAKQLSLSHSNRLESIAAEIKRGTYQVDPNRIAARILETAVLNASLAAMFHKS